MQSLLLVKNKELRRYLEFSFHFIVFMHLVFQSLKPPFEWTNCISKDSSTVKPEFKSVPSQHCFEFATLSISALARPKKERQIQNNVGEELI